MKRAVIAGGGTGGHFYPGFVLAQTLRGRGWQVLVLVRKNDPSLKVLDEAGIAAVEIDLQGLPRVFSPRLLSFGWKLVKSLGLVRRVLRDFHPDVVVGMGSYLSFPAVFAASGLGLARAVHESNAILGLANKACLPLGAALLRGLPPRKGEKGILTGTPIRPALWTPGPSKPARIKLGLDPSKKTILVFGGSQGARALNQETPTALKGNSGRFQILHLAGAKDAQSVAAAYRDASISAVVLDYLEEMESAYAAADLVLCRSGASTLAELTAQGKPAILVPYPFAAAGHQRENALILKHAGAAALLDEENLTRDLSGLVRDLLSESGDARLKEMSSAYSLLNLPTPSQTAQRIADAVEKLETDSLQEVAGG